ncbi:hypothetical protein J6590_069931 [Homalodisca vitripennis]|nr:hypothetical protein J6590_069931 [Homalodisca vitripennis]
MVLQCFISDIRGESESLTINAFSVNELIERMDTTRLAVSATSFVVGVVAALLVRVGLRGGFVKALTTGSSWRDMKMVMVVRSDLAIGRNKAAAQCAHAAINCYKRALTDAPKDLRRWETQGQTKLEVPMAEYSMMDFGSVLETVKSCL